MTRYLGLRRARPDTQQNCRISRVLLGKGFDAKIAQITTEKQMRYQSTKRPSDRHNGVDQRTDTVG